MGKAEAAGAHEHSPLSTCGTDEGQPECIWWVCCLACPEGLKAEIIINVKKNVFILASLEIGTDSSDPLTISFQ